jgi:hypothetical protein
MFCPILEFGDEKKTFEKVEDNVDFFLMISPWLHITCASPTSYFLRLQPNNLLETCPTDPHPCSIGRSG